MHISTFFFFLFHFRLLNPIKSRIVLPVSRHTCSFAEAYSPEVDGKFQYICAQCSILILVNNPPLHPQRIIYLILVYDSFVSFSSPFLRTSRFVFYIAAHSSLMLHGTVALKTPHPVLREVYSCLRMWLTLVNSTWYTPHNHIIWVISNSRWSCRISLHIMKTYNSLYKQYNQKKWLN